MGQTNMDRILYLVINFVSVKPKLQTKLPHTLMIRFLKMVLHCMTTKDSFCCGCCSCFSPLDIKLKSIPPLSPTSLSRFTFLIDYVKTFPKRPLLWKSKIKFIISLWYGRDHLDLSIALNINSNVKNHSLCNMSHCVMISNQ